MLREDRKEQKKEMNKLNVTNFFNSIRRVTVKHSPEILTGLGIAGMITTTILAVKATPKAMTLIEEAKNNQKKDELTAVETVKAAWKPYIPAVVTGVVSAGCLVGSTSVSARRNAALATAYQLSTTALSEYKEKVVETIGEKKEKTVREAIAKDKVEKNPVSKNEVLVTGYGDSLIYDPHSARYFHSTIDKVKSAQLELNSRMVDGMEMYISLNEFYDEIGLPRTVFGNDLGWRTDKRIDVSFASQIADDGRPCLVMEYHTPPFYGYSDLY